MKTQTKSGKSGWLAIVVTALVTLAIASPAWAHHKTDENGDPIPHGNKGGGGDDGGDDDGGGGDGGGTPTFVARAFFWDPDPDDGLVPGVFADEQELCNGFDYWDNHDPGMSDCDLPARIDINGGGRIKFSTTKYLDGSATPRWVVLNFNQVLLDDEGVPLGDDDPQIDSIVYGDGKPGDTADCDPDAEVPIDDTPGIDNVEVLISMDKFFAKNARNTHPLTLGIKIYTCSGGEVISGYKLEWVDELYVYEDEEAFAESGDVAVRTLSTYNRETGEEDRSLATLLRRNPDTGEHDPVGMYFMPVNVTFHKRNP